MSGLAEEPSPLEGQSLSLVREGTLLKEPLSTDTTGGMHTTKLHCLMTVTATYYPSKISGKE